MAWILESDIVTKFTEYAVNTPDFFIDFIQKEIILRDLPGLTNDTIQAIQVTGEHPLVTLTANFMQNQSVSTAGLIPAISVYDDTESEIYDTLGDGMRTPLVLRQDFIDKWRAVSMEKRIADGLLTDKQLSIIEQAIANNAAKTQNGVGAVLVLLDGYFLKKRTVISSWCRTIDEQNIIMNMLRSVIYDMRKAMKEKQLKEIQYNTTRGLVNSNFGRILHGAEINLDYINFFHNLTVLKEPPLAAMLTSETIDLYDTINNNIARMHKYLDTHPLFQAEGRPQDGLANIFTGDVE